MNGFLTDEQLFVLTKRRHSSASNWWLIKETSPKEQLELVELYEWGFSLSTLARAYGIWQPRLKKILLDHGVPINHTGAPRKTHCKKGHALTPENIHTYTLRNGYVAHVCCVCSRARSRKHNRAAYSRTRQTILLHKKKERAQLSDTYVRNVIKEPRLAIPKWLIEQTRERILLYRQLRQNKGAINERRKEIRSGDNGRRAQASGEYAQGHC